MGSTVYAATESGLSISLDGGISFTNRTTANRDWLVIMCLECMRWARRCMPLPLVGCRFPLDGGSSFTNKTTANGLGNNNVNGVYAVGSTVYAATNGGLSISTRWGQLPSLTKPRPMDWGVIMCMGCMRWAARCMPLPMVGCRFPSMGAATFTNKTTANGLGNNDVRGVYAVGSTVYAATLWWVVDLH